MTDLFNKRLRLFDQILIIFLNLTQSTTSWHVKHNKIDMVTTTVFLLTEYSVCVCPYICMCMCVYMHNICMCI